jgi:hypothetical protein
MRGARTSKRVLEGPRSDAQASGSVRVRDSRRVRAFHETFGRALFCSEIHCMMAAIVARSATPYSTSAFVFGDPGESETHGDRR